MIRFTFLSENKTDNPGCLAEHGLSIYIETGGKKLLFDTGASELFLKNAATLKIDLAQADACIISHGHYDHTEGVPGFCRVNQRAPIYIHKDAFGEVYGLEKGRPEKEKSSIRWSEEQRRAVAGRLVLTDGVHHLTEDIAISGTIPDLPDGRMTERFYEKQPDGSFLPDPMNHEQFLALRDRDELGKSRGVYLFSGCSHKGVIPVLRYVRTLFPEERILGLIAGMHLYSAAEEVRQRVVSQVAAEQMELVMPVHCTGIDAIGDLKAALGERCIVATAGDRYEF